MSTEKCLQVERETERTPHFLSFFIRCLILSVSLSTLDVSRVVLPDRRCKTTRNRTRKKLSGILTVKPQNRFPLVCRYLKIWSDWQQCMRRVWIRKLHVGTHTRDFLWKLWQTMLSGSFWWLLNQSSHLPPTTIFFCFEKRIVWVVYMFRQQIIHLLALPHLSKKGILGKKECFEIIS